MQYSLLPIAKVCTIKKHLFYYLTIKQVGCGYSHVYMPKKVMVAMFI